MADFNSDSIVILTVILTVLSFSTVVLRFRARTLQRVALAADDYLVALGLIFLIGFAVDSIIAAKLGNLGNHIVLDENGLPVDDPRLIIFAETIYATQLIHLLGNLFTKASIVCLYRRIFRGDIFNIVTIGLLVIIVSWGLSLFLAVLLQCIPVDYAWTTVSGSPERAAHCIDVLPLFYAIVISNMILDIIILTIPIPLVWGLQMSTKRKIAISGVFLLGAFVIAVSIVRVYFFFKIGEIVGQNFDVTYEEAPTVYWSFVESSISIVCACLPTLNVIWSSDIWGLSFKTVKESFSQLTKGYTTKKAGYQYHDDEAGERTGNDSSFHTMTYHSENPYRSSVELGTL